MILKVIKKCIALFSSEGWLVKVWEREVDENSDQELIVGKIYFRAKKGDLTLDVTYDFAHMLWESLIKNATNIDGITTLSQNKNLEIKQKLGKEKDRELLQLFGRDIPH